MCLSRLLETAWTPARDATDSLAVLTDSSIISLARRGCSSMLVATMRPTDVSPPPVFRPLSTKPRQGYWPPVAPPIGREARHRASCSSSRPTSTPSAPRICSSTCSPSTASAIAYDPSVDGQTWKRPLQRKSLATKRCVPAGAYDGQVITLASAPHRRPRQPRRQHRPLPRHRMARSDSGPRRRFPPAAPMA